MHGTLVIRPMSGDLTRNTDLFQKMDPYVKVFLGAQHRETRVARKEGKHPVWRDELTLQYDSHDDILNFEVWDEDTHKKDDLVGTGSIAVATVQQKGNKMQEWIKLSYKGRYAGEILVDIAFVPDHGMNQQNQNMMMMSSNMQAMPNQMMQSNYQNVYPMMSASQGMIPQQQIPQRPQYQQQNSFQQQPTFVHQNSYVSQDSMQFQQEFPQQIQVQPQYQQQNSFQQQQQQPILVKQNSYAHHYPCEQVQMQQVIPQQVQIQQETPHQAYIQEITTQHNYLQEPLFQKSLSYAPPIERASTINRTQLRARTQIDQRGQSSQVNPNQFDNFILRGA